MESLKTFLHSKIFVSMVVVEEKGEERHIPSLHITLFLVDGEGKREGEMRLVWLGILRISWRPIQIEKNEKSQLLFLISFYLLHLTFSLSYIHSVKNSNKNTYIWNPTRGKYKRFKF